MGNFFEHSTYQCPMHPEVISSKSGECPICGMGLEPLKLQGIKEDVEINYWKWRTVFAAFFSMPLILLHIFSLDAIDTFSFTSLLIIELILSIIVVFGAGWSIFIKGLASFKGPWNAYFPISLGIFAAFLLSLAETLSPYLREQAASKTLLMNLYFEPSSIMTTLILAGTYLTAKAKKSASPHLSELIANSPQAASLVLPTGDERKISVDDVKRGDYLRIAARNLIPIDGKVETGQSWVNEMMITGEAIPVFKRPGSTVLAGTENGNTSLEMEAKCTSDETILSSIIRQLSTSRKLNTHCQTQVEKWVNYMIPLVIGIALISALIWSMAGASFVVAAMHAISVLIIASPAAFLLSSKMSTHVGIDLGAARGIIVNDPKSLESMAKATTLIIGKTGALTEGKPMLTKVFARFPFSENEVLKYAASVEQQSNHPLAESIVIGSKLKQIPLFHVSNFQNIESKGVLADIEGSRVVVGNAQFLAELGIDPIHLTSQAIDWQKEGLTVLFVGLEYRTIGLVAVADPIKFTAERALQQLQREGIKIVMATGDSQQSAIAIAKRLQITEVRAEALPQDKMALIQQLQKEGNIVAMAGSGINDAPALSQADAGIVMPSQGDPFLSDAGITLMKGDLCGVVRTLMLSRLIMRNERENLLFAAAYNAFAIVFAAGGADYIAHWSLTPMFACIMLSLSVFIVIANALRLRKHALYD